MAKGMFVILLIFLLSCACSNHSQKAVSLTDAIRSEGISLTELVKIEDSSTLDGIKPVRYQLDNTTETIMIYGFGSKEKLELGLNHFHERQNLLSSHIPIIFMANNNLILYYSNVDSQTQTPTLNETKYGDRLQQVFNQTG